MREALAAIGRLSVDHKGGMTENRRPKRMVDLLESGCLTSEFGGSVERLGSAVFQLARVAGKAMRLVGQVCFTTTKFSEPIFLRISLEYLRPNFRLASSLRQQDPRQESEI